MSGTLPLWIERWLGLADRPGTRTVWRLGYHWPWPAWATLLLAAALLAAVVHVYLRENRANRRYRLFLAALRLAEIAIVLAMIAQVDLLLERAGQPFVVVVVDDTRSMNTEDRYDAETRQTLQARVAKTLSADAKLTRWNLARTLFAENDAAMLRELTAEHKLRFYFLSDFRPSRRGDAPGIVKELAATEAKGDSTRLGTAVRSVLDDLRGTSPAAVVLATDGINTDGPGLLDAAAYARRKGAPLFIVGIGSDRPARGLRLSDLEMEDKVFVNDLVPVRFKLTARGYAGKTVSIVLKPQLPKDPQAKLDEVRMDVTVAADGRPQSVVVPYRPAQPGEYRVTIDARSAATSRPGSTSQPDGGARDGQAKGEAGGEVQHADEPLLHPLTVYDDKIKVLLVDGSPRFEYRFLYNYLLNRDHTIDLTTFLQDADPEIVQDRPQGKFVASFPISAKELGAYDVVIFGDVNPELLGAAALQSLADYVGNPENGHALVLIAGPNYMPGSYQNTPLAGLMPFNPATAHAPDPNNPLTAAFPFQPTELGLVNPAMQLDDSPQESQAVWQKLPPLNWMIDVSGLKPAARVLAENPRRSGPDGKPLPLSILQYVGGGKVLFQATDETYFWRRREGDRYFARYWVQMLRFLARSKLAEGERAVRLATDRREYRLGDAVRMEAHFTDDRMAPHDDRGVTVELEQSGRSTEKIELRRTEDGRGHFEALLPDLPPGDYHARLVSPAVSGGVPVADFSVAPPPAESLRVEMNAAEMKQAAELTNGKYYSFAEAADLPRDLPTGRPAPGDTLPPVSLWNRWPLLAVFLLLLLAEWTMRKRKGMV